MIAYDYGPPTEQDAEIAREATAKIIPFVRDRQSLDLRVADSEHSESIILPAGAVALLKDILQAMAAGHGITLIPQHAELTTVEAANILNVSRPYLIKLLESGEIPFHKVGRHRRVFMDDLMKYMEESDKKSRAAMDELVTISEELGLYDE